MLLDQSCFIRTLTPPGVFVVTFARSKQGQRDLSCLHRVEDVELLINGKSHKMPSAASESKSQGRLLLVSNRLPITIKRSDDGSYAFSMSSGGLVTGLSGLSKTTTFQWYGWPGLEVPDAEAGPMIKQLKDEYGAVPVFIDDELADRHYNGFSSAYSLLIRAAHDSIISYFRRD